MAADAEATRQAERQAERERLLDEAADAEPRIRWELREAIAGRAAAQQIAAVDG